jgi:hypothetical protein
MDWNDPSLEVECPVCGAMPNKKCAMMSGNFCSESHIERCHIAENLRHLEDNPFNEIRRPHKQK